LVGFALVLVARKQEQRFAPISGAPLQLGLATEQDAPAVSALAALAGAGNDRSPHRRREAIARRDEGDETLIDIARSYNVSHSTISRLRSTRGFFSWA
jgi:hypothetical protein